MSLFVDQNRSLVNIDLWFIEQHRKHGHSTFHFILSQEEFEEWKNKGYAFDNPDKPIQKLVATFKRLTWKEHNSIVSRAIQYTMGPDNKLFTRMDPVVYRELKLKTCLKKWDIKDDEGNLVEVTNDAIDSLSPDVAQALLDAFEKSTEASEEDLKK